MPEYLEKHDLQTRDKYLADRQRYLQDIKNEILKETQTTLLEIKDINNNQNENISHISDIIDKLNNSSKDVLRQKIMAIYHANKKSRTLTIYDKEALTELYKDYKAQLGNSYIDKYYNRMITWKVIDEYDITE